VSERVFLANRICGEVRGILGSKRIPQELQLDTPTPPDTLRWGIHAATRTVQIEQGGRNATTASRTLLRRIAEKHAEDVDLLAAVYS
jgi:hypothetical protein